MSNKTISDLRDTLFSTLEGIKTGTLNIDQAKAVNEVARTIVETAKVEVDYLRVTGGSESNFIDVKAASSVLPPGITSVMQHRLKG